MNSDPVVRLDRLLNERYRQLVKDNSTDSDGSLAITPPLDLVEASDFIKGYEAGLFSIDEMGYAQTPLLPKPRKHNTRQRLFQLFWHGRGGRRLLFREGVCQLAAVSALVQQYGWPIEQVRLEPNSEDLGDFAYGVDLVVLDQAGGNAVIFGEVKRDQNSLRKLLNEIDECGRMGAHGPVDCSRSQHAKFAALSSKSTTLTHFWAVCPGRRDSFEIRFTDGICELSRVDDIPSFALG